MARGVVETGWRRSGVDEDRPRHAHGPGTDQHVARLEEVAGEIERFVARPAQFHQRGELVAELVAAAVVEIGLAEHLGFVADPSGNHVQRPASLRERIERRAPARELDRMEAESEMRGRGQEDARRRAGRRAGNGEKIQGVVVESDAAVLAGPAAERHLDLAADAISLAQQSQSLRPAPEVAAAIEVFELRARGTDTTGDVPGEYAEQQTMWRIDLGLAAGIEGPANGHLLVIRAHLPLLPVFRRGLPAPARRSQSPTRVQSWCLQRRA